MKLAEDLRRAVLQAAIEGNLTGGSQENWRFVRLGDISSYGEPVAKVSVKNIPANSWLLDLEDIEKGGRVVRTRTAQESKSTGDKAIFHQGDILYSKLRPYLQKVLIAPSDGYCTPELIPFHCHGDIEPQYIVYFLKAPSVDYEITSKSYGVKMPRVGTNTMKNLLVPLPPIDEQRRIVSRLNAILPKIAELEAAENELEALESKFPGDMRNSLLQAAIEGKLTGGKREGWQWVRLGDVGTFVRGHGIKKSDTTETGKPCIRYGQLYTTFKTSFSAAVSFVPDEIFQESVKVHKNDILMALTGENNVDIALAVAYTGDEEIAMGGDMTKFTTTIDPMYVVYFMNSPFAISHKSKLATGNIIVHISNDKLASIPFPLPPIEEQHRIVSRLNELLPLCEVLEKITQGGLQNAH